MIGLCGAQRTGKTTLAREAAEEFGLEFVETKTSHVMRELGLDPKLDYDFDVRLEVQWVILGALRQQYLSAKRAFIADRTPLDALAYMMADIRRETLTPEQDIQLQKYANACYSTTNQFFQAVVAVLPGISVVEEEGKAPAGYGYQEHINMLILGSLASGRLTTPHFLIRRNMIEMSARLHAMRTVLYKTIERQTEESALH